MYHRKDGKVVKNMDDLMSATRYASQSLQFATLDRAGKKRKRKAIGSAPGEWNYFPIEKRIYA
jgi:hypothetical protein